MKVLLLLVALVFLAGCVEIENALFVTNPTNNPNNNPNVPGTTPTEPPNLYEPPTGAPSIKIVLPQDGDVIHLSAIGIKVNVTNFTLRNIILNPVNRDNEGHIDYYMDDRKQMSNLKSTSFANVLPGTHVIWAELRNNDDTPLAPAVFDRVVVTTD